MKNTCPKITPRCNTGDIPCMPDFNPLKGIDDAIGQMLHSATYSILLRRFEQSDAPDFSINVYDGDEKYIQTIFYKGVKRAEIIGTYGNPFTFELKHYSA